MGKRCRPNTRAVVDKICNSNNGAVDGSCVSVLEELENFSFFNNQQTYNVLITTKN